MAFFFNSLCLLLLLFTITTTTTTADDTNHVKDACKSTGKPDLCEKALLAYPESQSADNLKLAGLVILHAKDLSVAAEKESDRISDEADNSKLQDCMNDCESHFRDAAAQLTDSLSFQSANNMKELVKSLQAAIAQAGSCPDECKNAGEDKAVEPIKKMGEEIVDLCNIVLSLNHQN